MAKKRTVGEQVKSGFRIAGLILLVFLVFISLEASLAYAIGRSDPKMGSHRFLAALVAAGLMVFMFRTTQYWAKWLLSGFAYALFRLTFGLLFAPYFTRPVARTEVAVWVLYSGLGVALTARHFRRKPRGFERLGLVSFVVGAAVATVYGSPEPLWGGLSLLGLAELVEWLRHKTTS